MMTTLLTTEPSAANFFELVHLYTNFTWVIMNHVSPLKLCPDRSLTGTVVVFPTSHLFNVDL